LFVPSTTDFEKILALLFAPAPYATPIPVPLYSQNLDPALAGRENDDADSDDSIETEREWIDQLTEPAQGFPPHVSEAMAIEMCQHFFFFFDLKLKMYFYRGHCGFLPSRLQLPQEA